MSRTAIRLAAVAAVWVAQPLAAQAYQCRIPPRISVPTIAPDGPRRMLPAKGYTLALTWSPAFCRTRQGQRDHALHCSGDSGLFGLTVHGLWPNSGRTWPQWCGSQRSPTGAELAPYLCMAPSLRLLARQWAKHGSCMTRQPATYFRITRILWDSLALPDLDRMSRHPELTAGDLRAQFAAANSGWSARGVGLVLDNGWLQEVRLCYDLRFRPAVCDRTRFGPPDTAPLRIWRGL